jgi:hypothetical protein
MLLGNQGDWSSDVCSSDLEIAPSRECSERTKRILSNPSPPGRLL